jgi:hypothetical protein
MKRLVLGISALVVLAIIASTVSAAPLAAIPNPGSASSIVVAQNTDASEDATWLLDFIDSNGDSVSGAQQSGTLKPYVATAINTDDVTVLGSGWNGSAILSSDRELASVAMTVWTGGSGGDGSSAAEYAGFSQGYDQLTFPYAFNQNRVTQITIQNTGSSDQTFYYSFIDRRTGLQSGSTTTEVIPGGAQRTHDVSDCGDSVVPTAVCTRPAEGSPSDDWWKGAVVVTSTQEVVAGVATTHWDRWSGQYVGVPEADSGDELIFPLFYRVKNTGGVFGENKDWHRYSDMNIANPSLSATATITVSLYKVTGELSDSWSVDIPPGSSVAVNTRYGGTGTPSDWATRWPTTLGAGWVGAAIVTSNMDIQGVCFNFWPQDHMDFVGGYNAITRASGKDRLFFPASHRSAGLAYYTQAQLQNTSATTTTVDIYFYDRDQSSGGVGNELYVLNNIEIPGNSSLSLNSKYNSAGFANNWFTNLGTTFDGSIVVITQDNPIAGIAYNIRTSPKRASAYNGIPLD